MKAEVTFLIPVRNGADYIDDCIQSILAQTFQNWSLYILDNQSTDNTGLRCRSYLGDKRITYVLNDEDLGAIGNFNKALSLVRSKYYAMLSHDDKYGCVNAVEEGYSILEADSQVSAIYSHIDWIDAASAKIVTRKFPRVGKILSMEMARSAILTCRNVFGVPVLVRRSAIEGKSYDANLYSTIDIDFSIGTGGKLYNYVIDRACYAARFHGANNTMRDCSRIRTELLYVADKHDIKLSLLDKLWMRFEDMKMRSCKFLFFVYLDHIRSDGVTKE